MTAPALTPDTERISVFRAAITQSEMTDDALDELSMVMHGINNNHKREHFLKELAILKGPISERYHVA